MHLKNDPSLSPRSPAPQSSRAPQATTRNGKIARLPKAVREELNRRLDDGVQGKALVAWLNGLPEVRTVMKEVFGGRAVTEQNLSEWRQGGFLDWQRQREAVACVRLAAEEARELEEELGPAPLTEVLGASVTLLLARLIREMGDGLDSSPEQLHDLLRLIRQWSVMRSCDHRAARLKMQQRDWAQAQERRERQRQSATAQQQKTEDGSIKFLENAALTSLARGLAPEEAEELRSLFHQHRQGRPATSAAETIPANPTESDRIAPKKSRKGGSDGKTTSAIRPAR